MSTAKFKTAILLILVFLNLALLGIGLYSHIEESSLEEGAAESLMRIMEQNGIEVADSSLLLQSISPELTASRDFELEAKNAEVFIGKCSLSEQGAGIREYSSERGLVRFRASGEFEVEYYERPTAQDLPSCVKLAASLLKKSDIEFINGAVCSSSGSGWLVSFSAGANGCDMIDCPISFVFEDDELVSVTGIRLIGEAEELAGDTLSLATAMTRFLEYIHEHGVVCRRIDDIRASYLVRVDLSGEMSLSPVWTIELDTGECYVSAVSGEIWN